MWRLTQSLWKEDRSMIGTSELVASLRSEGFEVSHSYLAYLLRERVVAAPPKGPGGVLLWEEADVGRVRSELLRRNRGPMGTAYA